MGAQVLYREESYRIMGACFEVYKEKGSGFLESVYQECLAIEFELAGIPFSMQPALSLTYKGRPLKQLYKPDFVCFERIVLEIKAVTELCDGHRAQVHKSPSDRVSTGSAGELRPLFALAVRAHCDLISFSLSCLSCFSWWKPT